MDTLHIFTMSGCEECKTLKETLTRESINFIDLDITVYSDEWDMVVKSTKQNMVPTIFMKLQDGEGKIYVPNVDFNSIEDILHIITNNNKMVE